MICIYPVHTIKDVDQLKDCPIFEINHYQWSKTYRPKAYGQMALLESYGIVISMTAMEKDPLRRYTEEDDPVYNDSGLEAFLNFAPENLEKGYFNFEMNANGAILSEFGIGKNRKKVKQITSYRPICTAQMEQDTWKVILKVPMELICDVYQRQPLKQGDEFTCNFFKISEDPSVEHYASYAPVDSQVPNFHLVNCFGQAKII